MKDTTFLVRHKTDYSQAKPVSTPIFQASAFKAGDPYFYSRKSNPNFEEVEAVLSHLEGAKHALLVSSGMAAIAAVLSLLHRGDVLVVNKLIYGCSYRFLVDYGQDHGISVRFADLSDIQCAQQAITPDTTMVFFETPTNPFLKTVQIAEMAQLLHSVNPAGMVVVDNTWATPLFQKPLQLGADICVYSGSKFFSGHSDIILGAVTTSNDRIAEKVEKQRFYSGAVPDPFAAWLLRRSLQTLGIRMERHQRSTVLVADFMENHPAVHQVFLPSIEENQLQAYGGLLFARLNLQNYKSVEMFMKSLELFDLGTAMASVASAVACPFFGSHLSMTPEEKADIGLDEFLVRLSIGLEDPADLIADLDQALQFSLKHDLDAASK
jgi:cystathionine gamma-lyase/cystathionine gamma-lyase/homocysteine desulfhydrase